MSFPSSSRCAQVAWTLTNEPLDATRHRPHVVEDHRETAVDLVVHLERLVREARGVRLTGLVLTDVEELRQRKRDDLTGGVVGHETAAARGHPVPHPLVLTCPRVRVDGQRQFRVRLARDVPRFERRRKLLRRQQLMKSQVGLAHVFLPLVVPDCHVGEDLRTAVFPRADQGMCPAPV